MAGFREEIEERHAQSQTGARIGVQRSSQRIPRDKIHHHRWNCSRRRGPTSIFPSFFAQLIEQVVRDVNPEHTTHYIANHDNDVLVLLDPTVTDSAQLENVARECINRVQKLRKKAGLQATDDIRMEFKLLDEDTARIKDAILLHEDIALEKMRGKLVPAQNDSVDGLIAEEEASVANVRFLLRLLKI